MCEIYLFNNLCVFKYLKYMLKVFEDVKNVWYWYWIEVGFEMFEVCFVNDLCIGKLCFGDMLMFVDVCFVL